jgi:hypothetical protein
MELIENGRLCIDLELRGCACMDSTFLGVLAFLALRLRERTGTMTLFNANERIRSSVTGLGVQGLLHLSRAQVRADLVDDRLAPLTPDQRPVAARAATILEAHQTLMNIDERNARELHEVAQMLSHSTH